MKLTKMQSREVAEKITNTELLMMCESAKNNITNWTRPSDVNKGMTKGMAWNILIKDFDVDKEYTGLVKTNMIREFGEYLPAYLKPYKKIDNKKNVEKLPVHQEPVLILPVKNHI